MSGSPPMATAVGYHDNTIAEPSMMPAQSFTIASRPRTGAPEPTPNTAPDAR